MSHPLPYGAAIRSPGGSFIYHVLGPVCMLYDREELPWPCCSLAWRGKQPSWRRVGKRFIPDLGCSRSPAYAVRGEDAWGSEWTQVLVLYQERLTRDEKHWWYTRMNPNVKLPEPPPAAGDRLDQDLSGSTRPDSTRRPDDAYARI